MKQRRTVVTSVIALLLLFIVGGTVWTYRNKYPSDDRFWLHRTNDVAKLETKGKRYKGVELDIVYYPQFNDFDNNHDPADSIESPIENMLEILGDTHQKIWFDYKNLTAGNAVASRDKMEQLLNDYGIDRSRCIVESHNYQELRHFHDHGFYTSFYVPVAESLEKVDVEKFDEEVRKAVASGNVDAVSFPIEYYGLIKKMNLDVDFLLWDLHKKWWADYIDSWRSSIRKDDKVKVILVRY